MKAMQDAHISRKRIKVTYREEEPKRYKIKKWKKSDKKKKKSKRE